MHRPIETPKYVGWWVMPGGTTYWGCTERPAWFNRVMMQYLLGWRYEE